MKKISILLLFISWTTLSFGQGELQGTWILESYTVDYRKPIEIANKLEKEKLTIEKDGRYQKVYHEEESPDVARLRMTYNTLDGKITKKYFDKDGYEIKVVRVKRKTDNGTCNKLDADKLRFSTGNVSYIKAFRIDGPYLSLADTVDNRVVWGRYKRR